MKLMTRDAPRLPVEDYGVALGNALAWLGRRYLLAVPVKAHAVDQRSPRYSGEQSHWHESTGERD